MHRYLNSDGRWTPNLARFQNGILSIATVMPLLVQYAMRLP